MPADQVQQRLILGLRDLLRIQPEDPDDSIQVGVGALPDHAAQTLVQVKVTPPARIVPGGLDLEFGFAV